MHLRVKDIHKIYRHTHALKGINLDIHPGEFIVFLGPSGSGKTTLLRVIAGLEFSQEGKIFFGHEDASRKRVQDRSIGFVFQHYTLFKHMTVFNNVAFGLKVNKRFKKLPKAKIKEKVLSLLEFVQLERLQDRYPSQLSGGQRQRVALARALAIEPKLLLLDEPFGSLDAVVRKQLRIWLREVHDKTKLTTIFVTHDQQEALELADRIVVMNQGQIEQIGTPDEVYENPVNGFVYEFVGESNVIPVDIKQGKICFEDFSLPLRDKTIPQGSAKLYVRPHDIEITEQEDALPAKVVSSRRSGNTRYVEAVIGKEKRMIEIQFSAKEKVNVGRKIFLNLAKYAVFADQKNPDEELLPVL